MAKQKRRGRPPLSRDQEKAMFAKIGRLRRSIGKTFRQAQLRIGADILTGYQAGQVYGKSTQQIADNPLVAASLTGMGHATGMLAPVTLARALAGGIVSLGGVIKGGLYGTKQFVKYDLPYHKQAVKESIKDKPTKIKVKTPPTKVTRKQQSYHRKIAGKTKIGPTSIYGYQPPKNLLSRETKSAFKTRPIFDSSGNFVGYGNMPKATHELLNLSEADYERSQRILKGVIKKRKSRKK